MAIDLGQQASYKNSSYSTSKNGNGSYSNSSHSYSTTNNNSDRHFSINTKNTIIVIVIILIVPIIQVVIMRKQCCLVMTRSTSAGNPVASCWLVGHLPWGDTC